MSLFTVPVIVLENVEAHPNADRLDLAVVGGFRAVIGKGSFTSGERVVYLPTDSVVPPDVATSLGIGTYLVGKEKDRVKAIRLRGILSEGIVLPVQSVRGILEERGEDADLLNTDGSDLASALGITKYDPPIPVAMKGKARQWPAFLPYYDIENVKRPEFQDVFQTGEAVVITEKRHGANMTVALGPGLDEGERAYVCSRGHALLDEETNFYWLAERHNTLIERLTALREKMESDGTLVESISLHGEALGCQDLRYGATMAKPRFEAFDLRVNGRFLDFDEFHALCEFAGIPTAPVLYRGPYRYTDLDALSEGEATGGYGHIREGIVIRPVRERVDPRIGRVQLKYISGSYLTRSGDATEMR